MTNRRVNLLLFLTILVTTALPLAAAFYLLNDTLQTSLNLGFNRDVIAVLDASSQNLKTLRALDPGHLDAYRQQFDAVSNLREIYTQPQLVKDSILGSLTVYFGLGLILAVLLSLTLATLLSRRIARSYREAFDELLVQRERVRYLEEMSTWQAMAKMLAHEIKNPLTPIEVLVTSLSKAYQARTPLEFADQLKRTEAMIVEELGHLKSTVNKFSAFSRLPAVQLVECNVAELVTQHSLAIATGLESADIRFSVAPDAKGAIVRADTTLLRQALTNIVRNGVEANAASRVSFDIKLTAQPTEVRIDIVNDGTPVRHDIATKIFEPYVTGTGGKDNMGLGLAIVRKIVIEHGGEVTYIEQSGRPCFTIVLPKVTR
ncbi:MAG TPA: ATP-binding protein [Steroidobacteraceae bacterium]|nr:ATP-binding protein [Steroidobacteraceae bacterium]